MRIYGHHSGKNNFAKHVARSYMFYSSKSKSKKNNQPPRELTEEERKSATTSMILLFVMTFVVDLIISLLMGNSTDSAEAGTLLFFIAFIPILLLNIWPSVIITILIEKTKPIIQNLIRIIKIQDTKRKLLLGIIAGVISIGLIVTICILYKWPYEKDREIQQAIDSHDFGLARQLNREYYNVSKKANQDSWYAWDRTIEWAEKSYLPQRDLLKKYPKDYIDIDVDKVIFYGSSTSYKYDLTITNNSDYDIEITSVETCSKNYYATHDIDVDFIIPANSEKSVSFSVGNKRYSDGEVSDNYFISDFDFIIQWLSIIVNYLSTVIELKIIVLFLLKEDVYLEDPFWLYGFMQYKQKLEINIIYKA